MADRRRVLTLILAGGSGGRLKSLTQNRAKPAVPFMGTYRLVDFALSNCMHSGLGDVWVIEQYLPHSLNDHLANGRPWDLDRTYGGLQVLPPYQGEAEEGFSTGNADALYRQIRFLRDFEPETILTMSADHVMRFDFRELLRVHEAGGAAVTMAVKDLPGEDVSRYSVVRVEDDRVTEFAYKPERPEGTTVGIEVFAYRATDLLDTLEELAQEGPLEDYGHQLLPRFVARGDVRAFPFAGYWRDVGTVESYWQAHRELLHHPERMRLDDRDWPIVSLGSQLVPARICGGATVEDSLIAPGAEVAGTVRRSVIGPGAAVEAGAVVEDAVVLEDARIEAGATVRRAVVDSGVALSGRLEGLGEAVALSDPGPRRAMRGRHRPLSGPA
jgi:glucose-1-phosphate adenylyltransferase